MVFQIPAGLRRSVSERTRLAISIAVFLGFGSAFATMLPEAYTGDTALKLTIYRIVPNLPFVNLVTIIAAPLGVYVAAILLLFVDQIKRIQGILFFGGSVIAIAGAVYLSGLLVDQGGLLDIVVFLIFFFLGLQILGGEQLNRVERATDNQEFFSSTRGDELITFGRAERFVFWTVAFFGVLTFIEANTTYAPLIVVENGVPLLNADVLGSFSVTNSETAVVIDLIIVSGLIVATKGFLGYEATRDVVIIGPKRTGKTHAILGLYIQADNNGRIVNEHGEMRDYHRKFIEERDFLDPNEVADADYTEIGFTYTKGKYFRKTVTVRGFDYPGELTQYIGTGLRLANDGDLSIPSADQSDDTSISVDSGELNTFKKHVTSGQQSVSTDDDTDNPAQTDGGLDVGSADQTDTSDDGGDGEAESTKIDEELLQTINHVLPFVREADTLCFLFDITRILGDLDPDHSVQEYTTIQRNQTTHDSSMAMATKSDVLIDDFENEYGFSPGQSYDEFSDYVNARIGSSAAGNVAQRVGNGLLPVYIKSDLVPLEPGNDEMTFKPEFVNDEPLVRGFDAVLVRLGEL